MQQYLLDSPKNIYTEEVAEYKTFTGNTAQEPVTRKNKLRSRRGLRIWKENVEHAVKEKQKAYNEWFQKRRMNLNVGVQKNEMSQSELSGKPTNRHGVSS